MGKSSHFNLITNPVGAFLPGNQASLEREWKRQLKRRYDIEFNNPYTITNMPISRYLDFLMRSGNLESYMEKLVNRVIQIGQHCFGCTADLGSS